MSDTDPTRAAPEALNLGQRIRDALRDASATVETHDDKGYPVWRLNEHMLIAFAESLLATQPASSGALPATWRALDLTDMGSEPLWLALQDGRVLRGVYEWTQGWNPNGFETEEGRISAKVVTHTRPFDTPPHPATLSALAAAPSQAVEPFKRYVLVRSAMTWCVCDPVNVPEITEGLVDHTLADIFMPECVFDALPEHGGFD